MIRDMERSGKQATARAVSLAAGKSPGWATPYLETAVEAGELVSQPEQIPRTKGTTKVYRCADSSGGAA